jgi:hypothetical protein
MKYLKHLGLAAAAGMALLALVAAGVASATQLDRATSGGVTDPLGVGTVIEGSLDGSSVIMTTGGTTLATCTIGGLKGSLINAGSSSTTVVAKVEKANLTWGPKGAGCTNHTTTLAGGELEVHHIAGTDNGTVTAKGFEWTVDGIFGVSCAFTFGAGAHMGNLAGTTSATGHAALTFAATITRTLASSGFCPEKTVWKGTYKITSPTGLFIAAS